MSSWTRWIGSLFPGAIAAAFALALIGGLTWAQCSARAAEGQHPQGSAEQPPPHGGQMAAAESVYLVEVVYLPQQTRVYLYGPAREPLSARDVRGQVAMRLHGKTRDWPFPLEYVSPPKGSKEQDYLAAAVNVSRVRDGDATATVSLENLPDRQHPKAGFVQTFAMSQKRPESPRATPKPSDREIIAQQRVCPVTGAALGSMGKPVKVMVKGQTVFLCCRGCERTIRKDPDKYLAKLSTAGQK